MRCGFLLLFFVSFQALACIMHDVSYYRFNPRALQTAMLHCPQKKTCGVSCEQLKKIAVEVNALAYELRLSPQDYGKKILALQTVMATTLDTPSSDKLAARQELGMRLAIVKWLESPVS